MLNEIARSIAQGNPWVWAIIVLSAISLTVFFKCIFDLKGRYSINFSKFITNLKKTISAEDLDRAMTLCKNNGKTGLPFIALRALEAAETDPTTVRGTIEEETIDFLPKVEWGLGILPACSLLVLLCGVLGTVDALMSAFHSVDVLDTAKKQATLAQSIASALNPTAVGLIAGLFMLAGHQILRSLATTVVERIHYGVTVLLNLLAPPEVANYMPVGAVAGGGSAEPAAAAQKAPQDFGSLPTAEESTDDSFDDVSVEDIKDEEEII